MGRCVVRSTSAVAITFAFVVSGSTAMAAPAESCTAWELLPPAPYPVDAVKVEVRWDEHFGEQIVHYEIQEPGGSWIVSQYAGCKIGALECDEHEPMVLLSPEVQSDPELYDYGRTVFFAANAEVGQEAGTYTITAESRGACTYYDGDEPYYSGFPASLPVTVNVSYYRAGEAAPCLTQTIGPAGIPAITASYEDGPAPEVKLATFEWSASAAEICDHTADAVLPGLDPLIGAIVAAAPPGPDEDVPMESAEDGTDGVDEATDAEVTGTADPEAPDRPRRASRDSLDAMRILIYLAVEGVKARNSIGSTWTSENTERLAGAFLLWLLDDPEDEDPPDAIADEAAGDDQPAAIADEAAGEADESATTARPGKAPGPEDPPPEIKPKHQVADSVWGTPTTTIKVRGPSGKKSKLKVGWYQITQGFDGRRDFYDRKGRLLGTSPPGDRDRHPVLTRDEWIDARDAHAAAKVEYVMDWFIGNPPPAAPPPKLPPEADDEVVVSLRRSTPVIPFPLAGSNLDPPREAYVWIEPSADPYYTAWMDAKGGIVLSDLAGNRVGRIHPSSSPGFFIRQHRAEEPPPAQ